MQSPRSLPVTIFADVVFTNLKVYHKIMDGDYGESDGGKFWL